MDAAYGMNAYSPLRQVGSIMRALTGLLFVALSLISQLESQAAELEGPSASPRLEELSDIDLGLLYLRTQHEKQIYERPKQIGRLELVFRRYLSGVKSEVQKRGSTQISEAIYDGFISSACPSDSFASGYARIIQGGPELIIRHGAKLLQGVVIKDTVILVVPSKYEVLIGNVLDGRIDVIAVSGACSMSFARAVNLHNAVRAEDVEAVESVIKSGANLDELDSWGPPLAIAVVKGADSIVKLLLDAGANIEATTVPTAGGEHPLHLAAVRRSGANIAKLLISRGAQLDARDKAGRTPLITAVVADSIEVAKVLLAAGADIEGVDSQLGATPLSWAACAGRFNAVSFLLSKGARINAKAGPSGDTPIHHAVRCCHKLPEMVSFLVANGANVNATNDRGLTPIKQALGKTEKQLLRGLGAVDASP